MRQQFDYAADEWRITPFGQKGVVTQIGDKIQCHICGEAFHQLMGHVSQRHGLTQRAYRTAFHLQGVQKQPLVSPSLHAKFKHILGPFLRQVRALHKPTHEHCVAGAIIRASLNAERPWMMRTDAALSAGRRNIEQARLASMRRPPDELRAHAKTASDTARRRRALECQANPIDVQALWSASAGQRPVYRQHLRSERRALGLCADCEAPSVRYRCDACRAKKNQAWRDRRGVADDLSTPATN